MTHQRAVWTMVVAAALWSIAGVVTRQLESAAGFELTFWRSAFNALSLVVLLSFMRGPGALWRSLTQGGRPLLISGVCWAVMFTAFMMALTLTTVANVLVTMSVAPLFTALLAFVALGHRLQARTWLAIALAAIGIAWMYGQGFSAAEPKHLLGTLVALAVPAAAAVNWTLLQHLKGKTEAGSDMLTAVLLGALISAAVTLPLAWPLSASVHDVSWLAMLGLVQLAIPCLMSVAAARVLPSPEMSLLALLEVVLGVVWAWLWAGEEPSSAVLTGGSLVLLALVINEAASLRQRASV